MRVTKSASGFTIVELMIATMVFSIILLLCSAGIIQIGRTYQKGIISARTQEITRSITEEVTQAIKFSGGRVVELTEIIDPDGLGGPLGAVYGFCIDDQRYSYVLDKQLTNNPTPEATQSKHVFVVDKETGCSSSTSPQDLNTTGSLDIGSRELMGLSMRIDLGPATYVTATQPIGPVKSGGSDLYQMNLRVVYGDQDVLTSGASPHNCRSNYQGGQFCAISELITFTKKRVN